jgi:ribosome-associated protein
MRRLKKTHKDRSGSELARLCARIALDKKAEDIVILDVRGLTYFTDYFVIMSARSTRHAQGLAEAVENELSAKRMSSKNCEGLKEGKWILLDYGDVVVHIFYREQRTFYDLDGLWHDAPKVAIEHPSTVG